jgi:hypothetical protein
MLFPKNHQKIRIKQMRNLRTFSLTGIFAFITVAAIACNVSTANLSSLKVSKDKEGTSETANFKAGDTIYGSAAVSNNPGKVKVKLSLADPKGETMKGSEVTVDIESDGFASYTLPTSEAMPAGTYKLTADMINDAGEKKDTKSTTFTMTASE